MMLACTGTALATRLHVYVALHGAHYTKVLLLNFPLHRAFTIALLTP